MQTYTKPEARQSSLTFILISIFISLGFILFSNSRDSFAGEVIQNQPLIKNPDYFTIKSVNIKQLDGPTVLPGDAIPNLSPGVDIVGIGQELWSIITANQPTVDANINNFSALPKGKSADDLENWSDPETADYQVVYANALGMNVVSFNYTISFQYGGSLGGVGRYVTGATMVPSNISVDWGYKLDAEVQNFPPTNIGTDKNPIAMIQMAMKWTVTSTFEKQQLGATYTLDGNGRILSH
jgi:hypothetical protein